MNLLKVLITKTLVINFYLPSCFCDFHKIDTATTKSRKGIILYLNTWLCSELLWCCWMRWSSYIYRKIRTWWAELLLRKNHSTFNAMSPMTHCTLPIRGQVMCFSPLFVNNDIRCNDISHVYRSFISTNLE